MSKPDNVQRGAASPLRSLLIALFVFSCVSVSGYVFFTYRLEFHSDSAYKVFLAEEIVRTGRLFPPAWNYITDLPIAWIHLCVVPWAGLIRDLFMVHAAGVFTAVVLFVLVLRVLFGSFAPRSLAFWLGSAVLLSGPSAYMAEYLYGQAAYLFAVMSMLLTLVCVYQFYDALANADPSRRPLIYGLALFFLILVNVMGGLRGILSLAVPACASLGLFLFLERALLGRPVNFRALAIVLGAFAVAAVMGVAAFFKLTSMLGAAVTAVAEYATVPRIAQNVQTFAEGFLWATGAMPTPTRSPLSLYGLMTAYRLVIFLGLALLPMFLLRTYRTLSNGALRFVILYQMVSFGVTAYYYIFGTVAVNGGTFRYFSCNLVLAVVIAVIFAADTKRFGFMGIGVMATLLAPLALANCVDRLSPLVTIARQPDGKWAVQKSEHPLQPVADVLTGNGLGYGYATYWNAGVLTVLSGGRARVNAVTLEESEVRPFRYLNSSAWYTEEFYRGPTFLLLTPGELKLVNVDLLEAFAGRPVRTISTPYASILVFDSNLAGKLPTWPIQRPMLSAMPLSEFRAELQPIQPVIDMRENQIGLAKVRITNSSKVTFSSGGPYPVLIGAHLYDENNKMQALSSFRTPLVRPLTPQESATTAMAFVSPHHGKYVLEIDLFQLGVTWFGAAGNATAKISLNVR